MKRSPILFLILLLSLLAGGVFAYRWQRSESRLREAIRWTHFVMDSLGTSLTFQPPPEGPAGRDSIYWQWIATTAQLQSRRWQHAVRYWVKQRATLLSDADIFELRRQGLEDPARQLRESLISHPELILRKGVLGGTMGFAPDENIVLLNRPYVFAEFDDGHIGGFMFLEYSVGPGQQVVWKRLWAGDD